MTTPYELIMEELQKQAIPPPPQFTPEQQVQRVQGNNQLTQLGLLGQMSGDRGIQGVGGQIFKQALGQRQERVTNRGTTDPLTGETAIDPAYAQEQGEARRGKVLDAALRFEDQRTRAQERADLAAQRAEDAKVLKLALGQRNQKDPELGELRKDLIRAQTDNTRALGEQRAEKAQEGVRKTQLAAQQGAKKASTLLGHLDRFEKMIGPMTTGLIGSQLRKVPGTDAYAMNAMLDPIRAGIGFNELQEMRMASPTGGALGQVAVRELELLYNVLGNLDPNQDSATVRQTVKQMKQHLTTIQQDFEKANAEVARAAAMSAPTPSPEASGGTTPSAGGASSGRVRYVRDPATGKLVLQQ